MEGKSKSALLLPQGHRTHLLRWQKSAAGTWLQGMGWPGRGAPLPTAGAAAPLPLAAESAASAASPAGSPAPPAAPAAAPAAAPGAAAAAAGAQLAAAPAVPADTARSCCACLPPTRPRRLARGRSPGQACQRRPACCMCNAAGTAGRGKQPNSWSLHTQRPGGRLLQRRAGIAAPCSQSQSPQGHDRPASKAIAYRASRHFFCAAGCGGRPTWGLRRRAAGPG